jgi:predicted phosphoadenosine phosphosulfate sulfurtransferase
MKIMLERNVKEQALERIRWLYDEFPVVVVSFSGGKDSTVCLELCLQVARERGRLPVPVCFIDQEAEWQYTIDYVTEVMTRPEVEPLWLQVPIKLYNATSEDDNWLMCWRPGDTWLRDKHPVAITDNEFGTDRFKPMFGAFLKHRYAGKACYVGGVRAEESPARTMSLTTRTKYKHVTWAKMQDGKDQYTFYPIYDWSIADVWKAIDEGGWKYNVVYDKMHQIGIGLNQMRVSNLHHETAVGVLFYMQEIDRATWEKLTDRLHGVNTAKHLNHDMMPSKLPYMFADWIEYRDFLLERVITVPEIQEKFRKQFEALDKVYTHPMIREKMAGECVCALLVNDHWDVKLGNFKVRQETASYRQWKAGKLPLDHDSARKNQYILDAIRHDAQAQRQDESRP